MVDYGLELERDEDVVVNTLAAQPVRSINQSLSPLLYVRAGLFLLK